MTRYLSTGLRIVTVAALTTGLAVSAMAQQTGSQTSQSGMQTPVKSAPVVDVKKDSATATKGTEVKAGLPTAGVQTQATGTQARPATAATPAQTVAAPAKPAAPAPTAAATSGSHGAPVLHDSKATTITTEKKPGG